MDVSETQPKKSLNWLQRLKDESWEAELLVSAIAVFGAFQLFDFVEWMTNAFIDRLPVDQYIFGYFISFSALLAVSVLVSMFIIHFFLRAYWIGLVGLNSVFPEYGLEDSAYSKTFTERLLAVLPTQQETIDKIDQLCSVIFAAAFTLLMVYGYIALTSSLYLALYNLLSDVIPSYLLLVPAYIIGAIYTVNMLVTIVANLKKFKEHEKVQLWYFRTTRLSSILTYGPLYKVILQVTMTFGSNFKKKKSMVGMVIVFLLSGIFVSAFFAEDSNIFYLFLNRKSDENRYYSEYYADQNIGESFLLGPEIESDIVKGEYLKIFIPIFNNEDAFQDSICGEFEGEGKVTSPEYRDASRAFHYQCYQKYHSVFLNDKKLTIDFLKHDHSRTQQWGILGYLPTKNFKNGKNSVRIRKGSDKELIREWAIPFYFVRGDD